MILAYLLVPILTGPHFWNAEVTVRELLMAGGACLVRDERELATAVVNLLNDATCRQRMGTRAHAVLEQSRGTLARLLHIIDGTIAAADSRNELPHLRNAHALDSF